MRDWALDPTLITFIGRIPGMMAVLSSFSVMCRFVPSVLNSRRQVTSSGVPNKSHHPDPMEEEVPRKCRA
jgi:hypothetical protein